MTSQKCVQISEVSGRVPPFKVSSVLLFGLWTSLSLETVAESVAIWLVEFSYAIVTLKEAVADSILWSVNNSSKTRHDM